MFDDTRSHCWWQEIDDRRIDGSRRCERPAFGAANLHNFRDLIGQLPEDSAVVLRFKALPFRYATNMPIAASGAAAIARRETTGLIRVFIFVATVRIREVKGLHELKTRTPIRRLIHFVCF